MCVAEIEGDSVYMRFLECEGLSVCFILLDRKRDRMCVCVQCLTCTERMRE
jgi:hypothetical protein